MKHYPKSWLEVTKITTKSYLDENQYVVFPQSLKITIILEGPNIKTKGPIGPLRPMLGTPMLKNIL